MAAGQPARLRNRSPEQSPRTVRGPAGQDQGRGGACPKEPRRSRSTRVRRIYQSIKPREELPQLRINRLPVGLERVPQKIAPTRRRCLTIRACRSTADEATSAATRFEAGTSSCVDGIGPTTLIKALPSKPSSSEPCNRARRPCIPLIPPWCALAMIGMVRTFISSRPKNASLLMDGAESIHKVAVCEELLFPSMHQETSNPTWKWAPWRATTDRPSRNLVPGYRAGHDQGLLH